MGDLGGIAADVVFDAGVADALATGCDTAATAIDDQAGLRALWSATALTDFRGRFSELFRSNAQVAAGDATELVARLREVAVGARRLKEEAAKEQQRREAARAWQQLHDARTGGQRARDALSGGDDPPVGPPAEEPTIPVPAPMTRSRQTPAPGGGGAGGGTSAARPSHLRTFATGSHGANGELRSRPNTLKTQYGEFQDECHWGSLIASGVFTGFDKWLAANEEDARWAAVVANAFKAAGGEGEVSSLSNSALKSALRSAQVGVSRADLVIDPAQAFGHPPTTGYAADPVNTSTGNFVEHETDLTFPGAASGLVWGRCYNSANPAVGGFGPGWSSLAEAGLTFDPVEGTARFRLADGRQIVFARLGEGWDRAVGENLWLARSDTGLQVSGNDGSWWRFGAEGTLLSYGTGTAAGGNTIRLVRDRAGQLVRLEHGRGRHVELTWGSVGHRDQIIGAVSSDGRRVVYTYDGAGRLTAATGPTGTRSYRWSDGDTGPNLVTAVVDADGVVELENTYDARGRVTAQRSPFGRLTRFAYLPGQVTVVSDEDGSRSNTWIADDRGRLVGVVDAEDHRQSTSYDRWGNPVLLTERNDSTTVHAYDDRGRKVRTVTPSRADLTFDYDDLDRVATVVTEQGAATTYRYDGEERNPSAITDPEGGVTQLDWHDGLLHQVTDPTGVVVRFGYDPAGDLIAVTNADGATARMDRDGLGRVVAAITPSGHRTCFDWDPETGVLVSRRDPDGAVWRYEHTPAGRLTAVINPTGARTSVEYGPHGEEARTVDPLGRAVSRQHDDLGNLAAVGLPDGTTWRFTHDALSRLTGTVDPTGGVWAQDYDQAGRLVATLDPTGVRHGVELDQAQSSLRIDDGEATTTTGFDPLGRVTSLGQADGSAALLTYDRCGRTARSFDADGGLTFIRRDLAGRPVEVTSPTGAVTRFSYDRCGRLSMMSDPIGAETTIDYDVDGHPVRQTLPTGEIATTQYDVCGRVVEHAQPGAGTLTYVYDRAGRVVEARDPRSGRRRFGYDAAGQLVAVADGNGGITSYTYDALGRGVAITNPLGGVTRREFDGMNRCVGETNPLGRTTRAGYDPAGRLVWQTDPDGHRTSWTYDAAGRPLSMAVDGRTLTTVTRDLRRRTVTIDDRTREQPSKQVLEWNRRGQLIRRARDGRAVSWSYDADGRRTTMTTPDGHTTHYGCDPAGRLTWVEHPLLGRAVFDHDASGRVTAATAGGLIQSWEHIDGWVSAHTVTDGDGTSRTVVDRDFDGRVTAVTREVGDGPVVTSYTYDHACQLIQARTSQPTGNTVTGWRYDLGGRLVAETVDDVTVEHVYDLAGQLLTTRRADARTSYTYDGLGRRTRADDGRGRVRDYGWSSTGYLATISDRAGDQVRHQTLHTDALGELTSVDGTEFFWDTAAYAGAPVLAGDVSVLVAGPLTGIGTAWTTPGWRTARGNGADPWNTGSGGLRGDRVENGGLGSGGSGSGRAGSGGAGFDIGTSGEVTISGLEWMGARVYDPTSRGFLSADPLDPVIGAGWAANPYAYAGNDPLHAVDPQGLTPVTDAQLQAYRDGNGIGGAVNTVNHAVGHWFTNNWEYVAGGAMVVAGGALIATGIGGPLGVMLVSAGADTIIQKASSGDVNWGQVGISFGAGAVGGGFAAAKLGATGVRGAMVAGAVSGGAGGGAIGGYKYAIGSGPHTVSGFVDATAQGTGRGAVSGSVGGAAGRSVQVGGSRLLSHIQPTTTRDTLLSIGRPGVRRLPMNMGTVRDAAGKHGIEINDLRIRINRSLIGVRGSTSPTGVVTLYRDAFENEEHLAKTLVHERVHVEDLREGMSYPSGYDGGSSWEQRAEAATDDWWDRKG